MLAFLFSFCLFSLPAAGAEGGHDGFTDRYKCGCSHLRKAECQKRSACEWIVGKGCRCA